MECSPGNAACALPSRHCLCLPLASLIPSEIVHIFSGELQKNLIFLSFWGGTINSSNSHDFRDKVPFCREVGCYEDPGTDCLTHFALCLSPFMFIFPFNTHMRLAPNSLVPVSVSRSAFSRGDSLAGSPGKHAWMSWVSRSVHPVGFAECLWFLLLSYI